MPPQNLKVQDITKIQLGDVLKNRRLFKHSFGDVKKVSDTISDYPKPVEKCFCLTRWLYAYNASTLPDCISGIELWIFSIGQFHHCISLSFFITSGANRLRISFAGTPPTIE